MMESAAAGILDTVAAGREAWARVKSQQRRSFDDWRAIGAALVIGREIAMKAAGSNRPFGKKYTRTMAGWLRENGLDDIHQQARYRAMLCTENAAAIETWREGLDDAHRRRWNHPDSVWFRWLASTKAKPRKGAVSRAPQSRPHRPHGRLSGGRPISFPQDMVRRAAVAIREAWTNDTVKLATIALAAAIRSQGDLDELLQSERSEISAPAPIAAHAA